MSRNIWGSEKTILFSELTPDLILESVEKCGIKVTGRCLQLNSMENRVFEVEREVDQSKIKSESDKAVIVKFYRPGRWSKEQILEEHGFLLDLHEAEISVVPPLIIEGETLFLCESTKLYYCLFPKFGGRNPMEMTDEQLEITGRTLARMHNVGESKVAHHRLKVNTETFVQGNVNYLKENGHIPDNIMSEYDQLIKELTKKANEELRGKKFFRIHGDAHWGNMISRNEKIYFIDFDDMLTGPAVQDIWLVIPGRDDYAKQQLNVFLEAYESMRSFDYRELRLVEILRAFRYIHFSAWIAKRWEDESFKRAFPQFGTPHYWSTQLMDLREQVRFVQSQPPSMI